MPQTNARKTLKDAPVMWRRINSIGVILDCNSTYASCLGYSKAEILGRPIFEHVPKESWKSMNDSLKSWFETGNVTDRKIAFKRQDGTIFPGLLQATSLYDEAGELLGSNTVIFNLKEMTGKKIAQIKKYFTDTNKRLGEIKESEHSSWDEMSRSEYKGLKEMFEMLLKTDLQKMASTHQMPPESPP